MPVNRPQKAQSTTIKITPQAFSFLKETAQASGKIFNLHFKKNNYPTARLGVILSKKAVNLAVLRNKIRRKLREEFKKDIKELGSYDILIVITRKINIQKENLCDDLIQEWKKLKKSLLK